jgi:hypothetical protein
MRRFQGWENKVLLLLLVSILVYSVSSFIFFSISDERLIIEGFSVAIVIGADNLCHWIITKTYLEVSFQTRMLLN